MGLSFNTDFEPHYGELVEVSPLLRRIVCNNPSLFTLHGTSTYVIGRGDVAVVDPGPNDPTHIEALLRALGDEVVSKILITHTHSDHSPGSALLQKATGAPILGFGPHPSNAVSEEDDVAEAAGNVAEATGDVAEASGNADATKGENGKKTDHSDVDFVPDIALAHGDWVSGPGWTVEALHTPGHISNHLSFALSEERAVLVGDHVMAWSTTIIPPPDGNVDDYLNSLRQLLARNDEVLYPTHGPAITNPRPYLQALLDHRLEREAQIIKHLGDGPASANEIVAVLYADKPKFLHPLAARSVVGHLIKLLNENKASLAGPAESTSPANADNSLYASNTTWELKAG